MDIFVSPNGNNASSGSATAPLKSIQAGLTKLRGQQSPRRLIMRPGEYYTDRAIEIDAADSGVEIIGEQSGETRAVVNSARQLAGTWAKQADGSYMLAHVGGRVGQVWVGGQRYDVSRLPGPALWYKADRTDGKDRLACATLPKVTHTAASAVICWPYGWYHEACPIKTSAAGSITLSTPCREPLSRSGEPGLFCVLNVKEGLQPRQFWHDATNAKLYVRLPASESPTALNDVRVCDGAVTLLNVNAAADVRITGFDFARSNVRQIPFGQGGDWTSHAIRVMDATAFQFRESRLTDIGAGGVWIQGKSRNCVVERCILTDIGEHGVSIVGAPGFAADGARLSRANMVLGCVILRPGSRVASSSAIDLQSTESAIVSGNLMRECAYCGVSISGTGGKPTRDSATGGVSVYGNVVDGYLLNTTDGAAYRAWGGTSGGNVIGGNSALNGAPSSLLPFDAPAKLSAAYYFDDWASGYRLHDNFAHGADTGIMLHACSMIDVGDNVLTGLRHFWGLIQPQSYADNSATINSNLFSGDTACRWRTEWGDQIPTPMAKADGNYYFRAGVPVRDEPKR